MDIKQSVLIVSLATAISTVWAADADPCVMRHSLTTSKSTGQITTKKNLQADVINLPNGQRSCLVKFDAQVNGVWHTAFGEHEGNGDMPSDKICQIAEANATKNLYKTIGPTQIESKQILECNEGPEDKIRNTEIGTTLLPSQITLEKTHPAPFWYQGSRCFWFQDSEWTDKKVNSFNGIACEIGKTTPKKLIVVDKF